MNRSRYKVMIAALGAGVTMLLLSLASWSMDHGGKVHDPERMVAHMTERLDLTEEQRHAVLALLNEASEQSAAQRQRLQELREQLRGQRLDFDTDKARNMADEIGAISGRLVYEAARVRAGIYQLLSAEQQAQMDAFMEKRDARREHWRGSGRFLRD